MSHRDATAYTMFTRRTANDHTRNNPDYLLAGLFSEVGELADARKKWIASGGKDARWASRDYVIKEAGDILWYLTRLLDQYDSDINEAIDANVRKLEIRLASETLVDRTNRREDPRSYGP